MNVKAATNAEAAARALHRAQAEAQSIAEAQAKANAEAEAAAAVKLQAILRGKLAQQELEAKRAAAEAAEKKLLEQEDETAAARELQAANVKPGQMGRQDTFPDVEQHPDDIAEQSIPKVSLRQCLREFYADNAPGDLQDLERVAGLVGTVSVVILCSEIKIGVCLWFVKAFRRVVLVNGWQRVFRYRSA